MSGATLNASKNANLWRTKDDSTARDGDRQGLHYSLGTPDSIFQSCEGDSPLHESGPYEAVQHDEKSVCTSDEDPDLVLDALLQYWKEVGEALSPHSTPEEAAAVSFIERRRLVHVHPYKVTVMFQARVELLRKFIINGPAKPLGDVHDHFDKYEWQLRGGIHYRGIQ